jgi:hypothetical protein
VEITDLQDLLMVFLDHMVRLDHLDLADLL